MTRVSVRERSKLVSVGALRRYLPFGLAVALGLFLSLGAFRSVRAWEEGRSQVEFEERVASLAQRLQGDLENVADLTYSLAAFYDASKEVERDEFATFTKPLLLKYPLVESLKWAPRVPAPARSAIEQYAQRQGHRDFEITERAGSSGPVRAAPRPDYFPVLWVASNTGHEHVPGFDLGSEPACRAVLDKALEGGQAAAEARATAVHPIDGEPGIRVMLPVYGYGVPPDFQRLPGELSGFVVATFHIPCFTEGWLANSKTDGINVRLLDEDAANKRRLLYAQEVGGASVRPSEQVRQSIRACGRRIVWCDQTEAPWLLECAPGRGYRATVLTWPAWMVLAGGLLLTAWLSAYLLLTLSRRRRVEQLIACRTVELSATNQELLAEVAERKKAEETLRQSKADLQQATEQAQAANRSKSVFLANMSHEIRTPMTAILGFTDVVAESLDCCPVCSVQATSETRDANRQHMQTIKRNGEHLLEIINDILDLSKIEAEKMTTEQVACSPHAIIAEVASLVRVRTEAKILEFNTEFIGPVPETIRTDPLRLRQILINLLGNAIKFTQTGGVRLLVRLLTEEDQPRMQFDVIDTGIGMTEEQAARIFQPFSQADTTTTRQFGGTGLGLTISKRLAQLLGGDVLLVESQAGLGTRFRATVTSGPLDGVRMIEGDLNAEAVTTRRESATATFSAEDSLVRDLNLAPALHGCRILLAEDGPDNQRLIAHVLRKAGAEVTVAENGKRAMEVTLAAMHARRAGDPTHPFDAILMDMQMPVMDGYEATSLLRQKGYAGSIIALTAHAMASDRQKCLDAGCDDYATKPIDRAKLIATIRQHLGKDAAPMLQEQRNLLVEVSR